MHAGKIQKGNKASSKVLLELATTHSEPQRMNLAGGHRLSQRSGTSSARPKTVYTPVTQMYNAPSIHRALEYMVVVSL